MESVMVAVHTRPAVEYCAGMEAIPAILTYNTGRRTLQDVLLRVMALLDLRNMGPGHYYSRNTAPPTYTPVIGHFCETSLRKSDSLWQEGPRIRPINHPSNHVISPIYS